MNEIDKIRIAYAELRARLGPHVPAGQILNYCIALIDFFRSDEETYRVDFEAHSLGFTSWAVDTAMAESSGWRVLLHECGRCPPVWTDEETTASEPDRLRELKKVKM